MTPTRTYDAMVQFVNAEYDKLQEIISESIAKVRKEAGKEDEFDVTLGLANRLAFYGLRIATQLHNQSLSNSRHHEPLQLELPFPPN